MLRRAVEDIQRIIQVRTSKQALNTLIQRGSVGDDLNLRFTRAEKEIEEELKDVVAEVSFQTTARISIPPRSIWAAFVILAACFLLPNQPPTPLEVCAREF